MLLLLRSCDNPVAIKNIYLFYCPKLTDTLEDEKMSYHLFLDWNQSLRNEMVVLPSLSGCSVWYLMEEAVEEAG